MLAACWVACLVACGPGPRREHDDIAGTAPDATCARQCSGDLHAVEDCHGTVVETCSGGDACDPSTYTCQNACIGAEANHRSVGCDYYATQMDTLTERLLLRGVRREHVDLAGAHQRRVSAASSSTSRAFARIPSGSGRR